MLGSIASTASGQPLIVPGQGGHWDGHYDLQGVGMRAISPSEYYEIVHSALIPPHTSAVSHPDLGCVILWGRRYGSYMGVAKTFVWNPRFPQSVKALPITVSGFGAGPAVDPFCSGHGWMPNGDFLIAGGTNTTVPQTPAPTGHEHVFRLSYGTGNAVWAHSSVGGGMSPMADWRWYPAVLQLADQRSIIHGTTGNVGGSVNPTRTRDVVLFSDPLSTAPTNVPNLMRDIGYPTSAPLACLTTEARIGAYARVFALRNSLAFDAGPDGDSEYWDAANLYGTQFNPPHPNCPPVTDRWLRDGTKPEMNVEAHLDGGAVHLITRLQPGDDSDPLGHGYAETIYQIGGMTHYEGAAGQEPCCGCSHGAPFHDDGTAKVEKIRNPTPDPLLGFGQPPTTWDDSPPDLSAPRANLTAVVLLDGSILVLGGERMDPIGCSAPNCTCIAMNTPELYKPPEVFGAGASFAWVGMNPHAFEHRYHSSAVLLPTGEVALIGGQHGPSAPNPSNKVIEVFNPPYLYNGPRPVIDHTTLHASIGADQTVSYDPIVGEVSFSFDVALGDLDDPITRVAVLRPASVTHSFDFNQRYVELEITENPPPGVDGVVKLTVARPPSIEYTPPGWYLLTAVDAAGRPADSKWIRFSP